MKRFDTRDASQRKSVLSEPDMEGIRRTWDRMPEHIRDAFRKAGLAPICDEEENEE